MNVMYDQSQEMKMVDDKGLLLFMSSSSQKIHFI